MAAGYGVCISHFSFDTHTTIRRFYRCCNISPLWFVGVLFQVLLEKLVTTPLFTLHDVRGNLGKWVKWAKKGTGNFKTVALIDSSPKWSSWTMNRVKREAFSPWNLSNHVWILIREYCITVSSMIDSQQSILWISQFFLFCLILLLNLTSKKTCYDILAREINAKDKWPLVRSPLLT